MSSWTTEFRFSYWKTLYQKNCFGGSLERIKAILFISMEKGVLSFKCDHKMNSTHISEYIDTLCCSDDKYINILGVNYMSRLRLWASLVISTKCILTKAFCLSGAVTDTVLTPKVTIEAYSLCLWLYASGQGGLSDWAWHCSNSFLSLSVHSLH